MRIERAFEKAIAKATVKALLDAGFAITVDNGGDEGEEAIIDSRNADDILMEMFHTDEDLLIVAAGWVRFIYGNDGYDVINDYTTTLEEILKPVNALADKIEAGEFEIEVKS